MKLKNVKLYRQVNAGGRKYIGSEDKRIRDVHYILDMFPPFWFVKRTVLDVGCAGGAVCFAVAGWAKEVTGIDVNRGRIEAAKKIAEMAKIKNICFENVNINERILKDYDCIFLLNVLHHERNPTVLMSRCMYAANEYLCIEHPKKGYFSSNNAYAETDKEIIWGWEDVERFVLANGFSLAARRKSQAPHVKGSRICGLFKRT